MSDEPTLTAGDGKTWRPESFPERIGHYRLIRPIGQGGMGVVYEAEQDQPRRTVALKLVRPGLAHAAMVRRFEHEFEALGRLQHPGIAQIFEAGMADTGSGPQPYFAMELVRGLPLTAYADEARLETRERLALFIRICDAVEHAHQRGVIHRDLKPGNILVDEAGQPKVLDFGIARITDAQDQATLTGAQLLGTLPYMSPEQVAADPAGLDPRSDVYALGVVLYELLAGQLPLDVTNRPLLDALRTIRDVEPSLLGTVERTLRGDLETIVAKALEKEPARRYPSAAAMAEDLGRHLRNEPIEARPASAVYQLQKFARRNKVLVAGVASVFVVLVAGVVAASWQAVRARQEAAKATAVQTFLQDMLASADPLSLEGSRDVTVREVLVEAAKKIEAGSLRGEPEVEAAVRTTVGSTFKALGAYAEAEPHLRQAVELRRQQSGSAEELATSLVELGEVLDYRGAFASAEPLYREALRIHERRRDGKATADVLTRLGGLLHERGDLEGAASQLTRAVEIGRRELGGSHPDLATSLDFLGRVLLDRGDLTGAEPLLREAWSIRRATLPSSHALVASSANNVGLLLRQQGDLEGAANLFREAWETQRRDLGDDHPQAVKSLSNLALTLADQGDYAAAEPLARQAVSSLRKSFGNQHDLVATALVALGTLLQDKGELAEAEGHMREALAIRRRVLPTGHPDLAESLNGLGVLLMDKGDLDAAEPLLREALVIRRTLGAPPVLARSLNNLAALISDRGRPEEAIALYREALTALRRSHSDDHPDVAIAKSNLATELMVLGEHAEAERLYREALAVFRSVLGDRHANVAATLDNLGRSLEAQGDLRGAEGLYREVLSIRNEIFGGDHPAVASISLQLARVLGRRGEFVEAERLIRDGMRIRDAAFPVTHWSRFDALSALGALRSEQKRFAEAERMLLDGQRGVAADPTASRRAMDAARKRLVTLYEAWGKQQEATRWR